MDSARSAGRVIGILLLVQGIIGSTINFALLSTPEYNTWGTNLTYDLVTGRVVTVNAVALAAVRIDRKS